MAGLATWQLAAGPVHGGAVDRGGCGGPPVHRGPGPGRGAVLAAWTESTWTGRTGCSVAVHRGPRAGAGERRGWAAGRPRRCAIGAAGSSTGRRFAARGGTRTPRASCARGSGAGARDGGGWAWPEGAGHAAALMRRRRLTPVRPNARQRGGRGPPSARTRSSREGGARGMLTSGRTEAAGEFDGGEIAATSAAALRARICG